MVEQISRRVVLKMAGALGAGLMLPGNLWVPARAQQEAPFPWTREEVLFGPEAGFEKAQSGVPLSVWADSSLIHFNLEDSIYPWNKVAASLGRDKLFRATTDLSEADIKFVPSNRTMVVPYPDYIHPYSNCSIFSNPNIYTAMAVHELGHTLGFVDFVRATTNIASYVNPARCDIAGKPYSGVMAYCDTYRNDRWFQNDDKMLLRLAGLA